MSDHSQFTEDLRQLAAEASELATRLCHRCQNFHLLWPYLRLAGASGGDVPAPLVHSVLNRLLSRSGRRVLIAGAADTGLLAVVARAASPGTNITVLDRCETPLELCRRSARRWSLPIETMHLDLMDLSAQSTFDVVLAHSILQFIPADRRVDVLSRMRRALVPGGRLVLAFRTSARIDGSLLPEYRERYPKHLIEQLEDMKIALPEPREAFRRRVELYSEERRMREGAHASRAEVEQLIDLAGLELEGVTPVDSVASAPFRELTARIGKERFLAIARPRL
jgi:SAM-dependent methyltransferase